MMPSTEEEDFDERNNNLMNGNNHSQSEQQKTGMTKAQLRKSNKPIMEKKRRARINHCLNELKTLILDAMKKDPARHTKLEKADILEMTVKHLQTIQRSQLSLAVQTDPTILNKFKAGFADCTDEVTRYINQIDGVESGVKQRLLNHLNTCVGGLQQIFPFNYGSSNYRNQSLPFNSSSNSTSIHTQPNVLQLPQDVNNNGRIQMNGVQLIPSRLPTGELALVMPNSSNLPYFPSSAFSAPSSLDLNPSYPRMSAFNSVPQTSSKHLTANSPPLSPISSMSSGEDTMPPTEFQTISTTPPLQQQQNLSNIFPTPPSGGSIKLSMKSVTLQQPLVTSTSELFKVKPLSVISNNDNNINNNTNNNNNNNTKRSDVHYVNKKRPYPVELNDGLLEMKTEPNEKIQKFDTSDKQNQSDRSHEHNQSNNDMWRPW